MLPTKLSLNITLILEQLIALDLIVMLTQSLVLHLEIIEGRHTLLTFFSAYGNMKIHMPLVPLPYVPLYNFKTTE